MPQWGLTREMRRAEPWGIPEHWLEAGKVVTDPVHGDIYVTRLERAVLDSSPLQRLRRIRQLATVHWVYPGATHTRFSHVLGTLRVVQDIFDIVLTQREGRHATPDLFLQWETEQADEPFSRRVAEAMVLGRLGALLHDVGHVPFGHTLEDDLGLLTAHDANVERYKAFWAALGDNDLVEHETIQALLNSGGLREALRPLILSKERDATGKRLPPAEERLRAVGDERGAAAYPFVADMVGNTICADLIDYLRRDHLYTGLPAAVGQRFMTAFYVTRGREHGRDNVHYPERMALHIAREGRQRRDIVSELLKHLRFRYELQERVFSHHAKTAADAMLGKLLAFWRDAEWLQRAARTELPAVQHTLGQSPVGVEDVRAVLDEHDDALATELDKEVAQFIELRMRALGDDGLLEMLAGIAAPLPVDPIPARAACRDLANDLLNRRFYKRAAEAQGASAHDKLFRLFGKAEKRRELEREAAHYASASELPVDEADVVLWVPEPRMRMKIAEVLVDYGSGIAPYSEHSGLGSDIYESHRQLWNITVYLHPRLRGTEAERKVLVRLAKTMGVEWDRHRPLVADKPTLWPLDLAARWPVGIELEEELRDVLRDAEATSFRGDDSTFEETQEDWNERDRRYRAQREEADPEAGSEEAGPERSDGNNPDLDDA